MTPAPDRARTVGARLNATAEAHPDRVALEVGTERSTYAALSLAGRAIAATIQRLPDRGAAPVVVVLARGGRPGVHALVGGWLAGLAVAPLGPDLPPAELAAAIEALSPVALFVDGASRAVLPALLPRLPAGLPLVLPDATSVRTIRGVGGRTPVVGVERRAAAGWRPAAARPAAAAAHLWVTHREGSRWVARSHQALLADVDRHVARHGVGHGDRVSHLHARDTHRGLVDLLIPWSVGAAACAPAPSAPLAAWLARARISVLRLTPTRLRTLEARGGVTPASLATVRVVVLEGEGHRGEDVQTLRAARPHAVIDSVFGRTEIGSAVLVHRVQPGPAVAPAAPAPLGRPFPGVQVVVGDAAGQPLAPGEVGRLMVRGPDGRPLPTADRVQVVQGRALRHCGRTDDRMQLNGRRVSLDAIGGVLAEVVGAPVVVVGWPLRAPGSASGLVGFVQAEAVPGPAVLEAAAARLRRGHLPAELRAVPGLPLRADGQPDRRRLTRFLAGRGVG